MNQFADSAELSRHCSSSGSTLAAPAAITTRAQGADHPAQRLVRSDARALSRVQRRRSPGYWKAKTGQTVTVRAVAWRLGQPGARGHRRSRRRRRHAGAGVRHRRHRQRRADRPAAGRSGCRTTARRTRPRSCSSCAREIPRASRTGAISSSRAFRSSRRTRRRRAGRSGTTSRPGSTRRTLPGGQRRDGARVRDAASTGTCPCSTPAPAAPPTRSCSAASATCCWRGRTKPTWRLQESKGEVEIVAPSIEHPRRAAGGGRRQGRGEARNARRSREAYLEYLGSPEGQEIAAKHHYRPRDPNVLKKYRATFAEREAVHDR